MNRSGIVSAFRGSRILVIGDAILDVYLSGTSTRLCREAPAPVVTLKKRTASCGGAANTAINLAALGARTTLGSIVGSDPAGDELRGILDRAGVNTEAIFADPAYSTPSKTRVSASGTIIARIDEGGTSRITGDVHARLADWIGRNASGFDAVVLSDYLCGVVGGEVTQTLAPGPRRPMLVVDARDPGRNRALQPDAIKPNYEETCSLLGIAALNGEDRVTQLMDKVEILLERSAATTVFATLDANGVIVAEKDQQPRHLPTRAQPHSRSIGAGDSFVAALTLALCNGASAADAAIIAQAAAEVVLDKEGTGTCDAGELLRALAGGGKYHDNAETLAQRIDELRRQGRRVVFTNGCFDILHRGHVDFLREARRLGDFLVVALNSDASIRRIKGPGRPINTLSDRIEVLSGLQFVDALVAFDDDTPVELLRRLRPEVFVKGGAYASRPVPEAELVRALGGEVRLLPSSGDSTGQLLRRIRNEGWRFRMREDGYRP